MEIGWEVETGKKGGRCFPPRFFGRCPASTVRTVSTNFWSTNCRPVSWSAPRSPTKAVPQRDPFQKNTFVVNLLVIVSWKLGKFWRPSVCLIWGYRYKKRRLPSENFNQSIMKISLEVRAGFERNMYKLNFFRTIPSLARLTDFNEFGYNFHKLFLFFISVKLKMFLFLKFFNTTII